MNSHNVKVGDRVTFFQGHSLYGGVVQKTDNADVQQVVVGDIVPAIPGSQQVTVRYINLINPPGTKVGFAYEGKNYTGVVQTTSADHQVVVGGINPSIEGKSTLILSSHILTEPVSPSGLTPLAHEQVHAGKGTSAATHQAAPTPNPVPLSPAPKV